MCVKGEISEGLIAIFVQSEQKLDVHNNSRLFGKAIPEVG